uniref:EML-like first beta-propeller domain-containing protein n=1 Tax=Gadus morhua TaxID=8049 RepID=A0A8C4ZLP0_GADMO
DLPPSPLPSIDAESNGVSPEQPENEEDVATRLPVDMYYQYDELYSKPFATPDSDIPENLLNLSHSFGYDCGRRANLQLLDESTLAFIAGNVLVMLDISTKQQHYLRSCSGGGIGAIMSHPSKEYFAVAEKGHQPFIVVYEYPSLQPYRILRGGTALAYSYVDFSPDGSLLASMGSAPDYMLTLWDWKHEQVVLRCKAFSQEVYRVTFSPENPAHMTTSGSGHIKFWKMASTFTGLKLQGLLGMFGKTSLTDIECYVELPDGKVVSGSKWGNMLVWDGGLIKVEVCRKNKKTCHAGTIQQFSLDKGELMSIGADGAIRTWDFEILNTANASNDSGLFEMEPMNELRMGGNASLCSLVKSSVPESSIWFAQDSNGGVWRLDLSFSNISEEPTCLFTCHAGVIQGMDVSRASHLMATTALDCSVKVFDFLSKTELTCSQFKQGGTALIWAPSLVNEKGGLLVTGFQDGVVRLLELLDPQGVHALAGSGDAELRLKQALKPHNAPVTAIAYERNGEVLATGSAEGTVFFFAVGEEYKPIGLINVPGPVQGLEWSPYSDCKSTLLVFCRSGHVVEVQPPEPVDQNTAKTYRLSGLPTRTFHFRSIRSRIKVLFSREEEVARRRVIKEARRIKSEERRRKAKEQGLEPTEEDLQEEEDDEGDLPSIFIPEPPSPLFCGFRSEPGMFWLSMGGYDSGFLYHCRFSEEDQDRDPKGEPQDEPFAFLAVHNADGDPIHTVSFSEDQQLMLCGMHSGVLRAYPLGPADQRSLSSLGAYWALSLHDNQYGHLRHARFSHDGRFVLTAGEDGNIFSLSVPLPREHSPIETAKQRLELDRLKQQAEASKTERRGEMTQLRKRFRELLRLNDGLPERVRLHRTVYTHTHLPTLMLFETVPFLSYLNFSYAAKPDENCEDPADVLAIKQAIENMGDFKLKTDKDYSVPEHLRTSADKKRADLVYAKKTEMNARVVALRDAKVRLVSRQRRWSRRLQRVGQQLPPHLVRPLPAPLVLRPEEVPERRLQYSRATLERYAALRADGSDSSRTAGARDMAEARAGFDGELRLLRHQKLELDCQVKRADLQHVTLFQELLLLQDFEDSQSPLQGRLQDQLDGCGEQLEAKRDDIGKLQESDQAMMAALQVSVGKNHPFSDFLTRVFKKKIKRVKAKEPGEEEGEWEKGASVCVCVCLFEMVIQMREQRLDLEDHLAEEKAAAESLKKEYDSLAKKLKVVQASVKAAEEQLEMLSRELQQRLNQLYVVVPLRLHQIEFVRGGTVPSDLSQAVVVGRGVVPGLQTRVQGLQAEKQQQREQYRLARQQNVLLLRHRAHMEAQLLGGTAPCWGHTLGGVGGHHAGLTHWRGGRHHVEHTHWRGGSTM